MIVQSTKLQYQFENHNSDNIIGIVMAEPTNKIYDLGACTLQKKIVNGTITWTIWLTT
jgi:hypothetical protein